jgi:hypothetical protein
MSSPTGLMQTRSNLPSVDTPRINVVAAVTFLAPVILGGLVTWLLLNPAGIIAGLFLGLLLAQAPKIARQWERAVVLRLGRYVGLRGPGLFWIIPFVDTVSAWVDQRVITTSFAAEETLTSDTVPVNVDAVRSRESRAGSAELSAGGELGGADGAARHHRSHFID